MSAFRSVTQGFRNLWAQGGDDEYEDVASQPEESYRSSRRSAFSPRPLSSHQELEDESESSGDDFSALSSQPEPATERFPRRNMTSSAPLSGSLSSAAGVSFPSSDSTSSAHRARPHAMPLRSREKNIYTLKPKSMDEASLAADYLKTGCAVVLNLEEVERVVAVRIIDFMSGVCYGLEHQGHAMKLGDVIFLFTPGDFEISSDEVDYGENLDILFKDIQPAKSASPQSAFSGDDTRASMGNPMTSNSAVGGASVTERRSWER